MALVTLRGVTAAFGGPPVLDGVDLVIEPRERVCLVGRNGAGKSTLLRIIAGEIRPDSGEVEYGRGVRVAALAQEVPGSLEGTCADVVRAGLTKGAAPAQARGGVAAVLTRLGLAASAPCASLSGGQRRRLLLARALVGEPDLLLLDEPTNHLDIDAIVLLEAMLLRFAGAVVFVTHDRMLTDRLATRIVDLDRGRLSSWPGSYRAYLEKKRDALEAEEAQRSRLDKRLAGEEAWLRKGIKARRTRNEGRVRALLAMRERVRARRDGPGAAKIELEAAGRGPKRIAEASGVSFAYGDGREEIIRGFSGVVWRGDRIGIIGPNGAGKTTLLRLLLGALEPSSGTVRLGDSLAIAYLDQLRAQLDPAKSVRENVLEAGDTVVVNGRSRHIFAYLEDFLFSSERARTPVSVLSGGEKNRLLLARLFTSPANVLVLDEPTNDLDAETLELLEELLVEYEGTVLLVSHDRTFLNNVVTSTLAFEGDGRIGEYVGGYDEWLAQRPPEEPPAAQKPVRERSERERPARPRGLTFKERFELEALPGKLEALEAEVAAHRATLADPGFYRSSGERTAEVASALAAAEKALAAAYDRWAELEAIREASVRR